jgi:hypothetical protein
MATTARAQRIEASVEAGYSLSEGIELSEGRPIVGQVYDELDITSGGSWGMTVGVFVTEGVELEFLYSRQFSSLQADGPAATSIKIGDMGVDNFHGNFVYNYGEPDARVRPFIFGGLGATHYSPGDPSPQFPFLVANRSAIDGETRFSSTWGGGVKVYAAPKVGLRVSGRWTPTYIKSDEAGLWCDPFYPTCWVVGNPDYTNQFVISGGATFRF